EARHGEDAGEEEGVVVERCRRRREPERVIDADAEYEEISERVEQVPEDERDVGRPDLAFAIHDGEEGAQRLCHEAASAAGVVSSTNTSSRLAPPSSTRSTRPRLASSLTSASTCCSSALTASSTVVPLIRVRSAPRVAISLSRPSGT